MKKTWAVWRDLPTAIDCEKQLNFTKKSQWQAETKKTHTKKLGAEAVITWYRKNTHRRALILYFYIKRYIYILLITLNT